MMSETTTTQGVPRARVARSERVRRPARARGERKGQGKQHKASEALERVRAFAWRFKVVLLVVAVLIVSFVALYGPAQNLYQAWRVESARQETLDALNESNEEFQEDIERLQTREGIEDEARKHGYVGEGETSIVVDGLSEEDADATDSEDDDATEDPWYLSITDFIFQYEAQ